MSLSIEPQHPKSEGRRSAVGKPLIDIPCVAEALGVTPRHIQRLVAERRIPYLKVGRFVRFDPAELSVWLDQQRREVRSPARYHGPRR
jgi:excisionase family DNA binding protein